MKRTVRVVIEKEYEVELKSELLTQAFADEFESYMFTLDGDTLKEKQEHLCKFAAAQLAQYDNDFIEGIGQVASVLVAPYHEKDGHRVNVVWKDNYEDVETEIV